MKNLRDLLDTFPHKGALDWIGVRPARKAPMVELTAADVQRTGISGDRHSIDNKRAITLIQAEHLPVIAALSRSTVTPTMLRRNLVVSGINLSALRGHHLKIGEVTLEITGICAPCSRMEEILGPGGYNAMRGHGGMTARILVPGQITIADQVTKEKPPSTA